MKSESSLYILQLIFEFICTLITLYIFLLYHLLQYLFIFFYVLISFRLGLLDIMNCVLIIFVPAYLAYSRALKMLAELS